MTDDDEDFPPGDPIPLERLLSNGVVHMLDFMAEQPRHVIEFRQGTPGRLDECFVLIDGDNGQEVARTQCFGPAYTARELETLDSAVMHDPATVFRPAGGVSRWQSVANKTDADRRPEPLPLATGSPLIGLGPFPRLG